MLQDGACIWEELPKLLRRRQAGAAGARNRHVPLVRSGSERAVRTHLMTARYVALAAGSALRASNRVDVLCRHTLLEGEVPTAHVPETRMPGNPGHFVMRYASGVLEMISTQ